MSSIILYTFEDADGEEDTFQTSDAQEAERRGREHNLAVYANEYEYADRDLVWDFTEGGG